MKTYLEKRIDGLTKGIANLEAQIAEAEKFLLEKRTQRVATAGALEEAKEALAELNKPAPTDGPKET